MHDVGGLDASQLEVQALKSVGEPLVIDPQQMHRRGMQIPDVNGMVHGVVAELVRPAVAETRLDSRSCHPDRKASRMVISSSVGSVPIALPGNAPPKLSTPNHQGVLKQTVLL